MEKQMIDLIKNTLFIFAPVLGYIPQIVTRNIVFSPLLSLMLITSSICKLYYYQLEKFNNVILAQAAVTALVQIALIYNYKHNLGILESKIYNNRKLCSIYKKHGLFALNMSFIVAMIITIHMVIRFIVAPDMIFNFCGHLNILLESSVGIVQILIKKMDKKYVIGEGNRKTRLPKELFLSWIIGDIAKLYMMSSYNAPWRLTLPIYFQIIIDVILMFQ